jgi:hypothetical protein
MYAYMYVLVYKYFQIVLMPFWLFYMETYGIDFLTPSFVIYISKHHHHHHLHFGSLSIAFSIGSALYHSCCCIFSRLLHTEHTIHLNNDVDDNDVTIMMMMVMIMIIMMTMMMMMMVMILMIMMTIAMMMITMAASLAACSMMNTFPIITM